MVALITMEIGAVESSKLESQSKEVWRCFTLHAMEVCHVELALEPAATGEQ